MAGTAIYFKLKDKVIDGTPCNQETTDICVDGKCLVSYTFYKNVIYELTTTSQMPQRDKVGNMKMTNKYWKDDATKMKTKGA